MEVLGAIAEDGCKYQINCRNVYKSLSEKVESTTLLRWSLTLSAATAGSECGKPIPKCKIYRFLEETEKNEPIETLLRTYTRDNWKIER